MNTEYNCWRCAAALEELILPMSRREECRHCGADQHVCKLCMHYADTSIECSEERAEPPSNKEAANFCDYFSPQSGLQNITLDKEQAALQELNALFGDAPEPAKVEPEDAEASTGASSDAEAELKRLFGSD